MFLCCKWAGKMDIYGDIQKIHFTILCNMTKKASKHVLRTASPRYYTYLPFPTIPYPLEEPRGQYLVQNYRPPSSVVDWLLVKGDTWVGSRVFIRRQEWGESSNEYWFFEKRNCEFPPTQIKLFEAKILTSPGMGNPAKVWILLNKIAGSLNVECPQWT